MTAGRDDRRVQTGPRPRGQYGPGQARCLVGTRSAVARNEPASSPSASSSGSRPAVPASSAANTCAGPTAALARGRRPASQQHPLRPVGSNARRLGRGRTWRLPQLRGAAGSRPANRPGPTPAACRVSAMSSSPPANPSNRFSADTYSSSSSSAHRGRLLEARRRVPGSTAAGAAFRRSGVRRRRQYPR